jgi:coniferyl-aldehyde dehydrogenase
LHASYPLARAVDRLMTGKLLNAGQTCVAPDYVLLREGQEEEFEAEARRAIDTLYPSLVANADYTRIVNGHHYARLQSLVRDAVEKGARVVEIVPDGERGTPDNRVFAPTLVFDPDETMALMREEIFGPVLPVVTYRTIDDAIAYVNARPRPLALYYFDDDAGRVDHLLSRTLSGGVTINDCVFHLGQYNLPFGGVGASGMGQYHGFDGFQTFSKKRGVMVQRRFAVTSFLHAPYAGKRRLIDAMLRFALRAK